MSFDADLVNAAVASGLSAVCATCKKYWRARDAGLPEPRCLSVDKCGSPLVGDTFHEYDGPLPHFERWCFRCGTSASHVIRVADKPRLVGVCSTHLRALGELEPVGLDGPPPVFLVRGGQGEFVPLERLLPPAPRRSLAQAMRESEEEFAHEDKKRDGGEWV